MRTALLFFIPVYALICGLTMHFPRVFGLLQHDQIPAGRAIVKQEADSTTTFSNPLLRSGPDPWVIQKDGFYYYMHTEGNRLSIYKTRALSQLNKAEKITVYTAPAEGDDARNLWAPELHFINHKWYLYYTAGSTPNFATQRIHVLENSNADPTKGTWIRKGMVKDQNSDFFAIDATIATINKQHYMIWSGHASATDNNQQLYIAALKNPWELKTARAQISAPDYDWEKIGNPHVNEGPEILKNKKGRVFLIFSASGCWTDDYSLGMLSLKENADPMLPGNWIKTPQPVFTKNAGNGAYGPGHNSFFKSPDGKEDWIIYHANEKPDQKCSNERNPRIQRFSWNADGTPSFGSPAAIHIPITRPSGEVPAEK